MATIVIVSVANSSVNIVHENGNIVIVGAKKLLCLNMDYDKYIVYSQTLKL